MQIKLRLIAFIFARLTISRKRSNPSSLNLLHHGCHSNVWATNWFSLPCWFPYQAYCRHGRWEALRVTLLLQQIWWIAQTVCHLHPCRRAEEESVFVEEHFLTLCNIVLLTEWLIGSGISILCPCCPTCTVACSWNHIALSHNVYCGEERGL